MIVRRVRMMVLSSLRAYFRDTSLLPAPSSAARPTDPGPSALRPNGHGALADALEPGGLSTLLRRRCWREAAIDWNREVVAMTEIGAGPILARASVNETVRERLLCPFTLQLWTVDRMLNFEIENDPHYTGLELQVFDDPAHGQGMAVLVRRRGDGRIDIYRQPGLTLDPAIAQVGGELGNWLEAPIDPARFVISPDGIDVEVGFTDEAGRVLWLRIDDRDGRRRHRGTLLAPVGAVVEDPRSLPLFVMGGCDLVRRSGRIVDIRIDGHPVTTGRLPGGWLHRRRLIKYTADPTVVICNPAHEGPVDTVDPPGTRPRRARPTVERDRGPASGQRRAPRPPGAGPGSSRACPAPTTHDRRRDLATRRRRHPGRRRRLVDRRAAPGSRRAPPRRRPGLEAGRPATAHDGRHTPCPGLSQLADDLPLVGNGHPRGPADTDLAVGAHRRPARRVLPAAHGRASTVAGGSVLAGRRFPTEPEPGSRQTAGIGEEMRRQGQAQ